MEFTNKDKWFISIILIIALLLISYYITFFYIIRYKKVNELHYKSSNFELLLDTKKTGCYFCRQKEFNPPAKKYYYILKKDGKTILRLKISHCGFVRYKKPTITNIKNDTIKIGQGQGSTSVSLLIPIRKIFSKNEIVFRFKYYGGLDSTYIIEHNKYIYDNCYKLY